MSNKIMLQVLCAIVALTTGQVCGENIDPDEDGSQYAWGENVGWLNFEPLPGPGVQVSKTQLVGFIWAENIGWINLSPSTYGGVINEGGNLSGYAWGENVGWINFKPRYGGVHIDGSGNFQGHAWGENIGWIIFDSNKKYNVQACTITLEDLAALAGEWLEYGETDWDLDKNKRVDLGDFALFSAYWLDYCPGNWP